MDRKYLQNMAEELVKHLPDGHGFILLTFPFERQGDGRTNYISNAERKSAVSAVKEWLYHCGIEEEWMEHTD